eukprot:8785679-Heterocapsa_arctica.AAC.1
MNKTKQIQAKQRESNSNNINAIVQVNQDHQQHFGYIYDQALARQTISRTAQIKRRARQYTL